MNNSIDYSTNELTDQLANQLIDNLLINSVTFQLHVELKSWGIDPGSGEQGPAAQKCFLLFAAPRGGQRAPTLQGMGHS